MGSKLRTHTKAKVHVTYWKREGHMINETRASPLSSPSRLSVLVLGSLQKIVQDSTSTGPDLGKHSVV